MHWYAVQGKLCVLLDLDGTLVSSFTPKRAPRLPAYVKTHVVGVGSKLNPQGVFVVQRPGLTQFLEQLSTFAEVVVFTAGGYHTMFPYAMVGLLRGSVGIFVHKHNSNSTLSLMATTAFVTLLSPQ
jgi:ABC-type thiamin/hydroxymethylpyrimidine transport system permease subunit